MAFTEEDVKSYINHREGRLCGAEEHWLDISVLKGLTLAAVYQLEKDSTEAFFLTSEGRCFKMYHEQDCCESVYIEDVCGDINDLVGSAIIVSEEVSSDGEPALDDEWDDSYTWTFYKLATSKGYVDIRWYGISNGYYSEDVDFVELI